MKNPDMRTGLAFIRAALVVVVTAAALAGIGCAGDSNSVGTDEKPAMDNGPIADTGPVDDTPNAGDTGIHYPDAGYVNESCTTKIPVADKAALLAQIPAEWPQYCHASTGPLPTSATLEIATQIVLDWQDLAVPPICLDPEKAEFCRPVAFVIATGAAAETLTSHEDGGASSVRLTGNARLMGAVRFDVSFGYHPEITILPPCVESCDANQLFCAWNSLCIDNQTNSGGDYRYCRECLGGSEEACLCRKGGQPLPDGITCNLVEPCHDSFDTRECRSGLCVPVPLD